MPPYLYGDIYTGLLMTGCPYTRLPGFTLELWGRARAGKGYAAKRRKGNVAYTLRQALSSYYYQRPLLGIPGTNTS